eukprot:GEZU01036483.1.p1 GENE.GEZU01036483.1~~GEZU01036483.1.p1  ORF type:complete len:256 (+),score=67.85 GEZU01036483.1:23-790(+)
MHRLIISLFVAISALSLMLVSGVRGGIEYFNPHKVHLVDHNPALQNFIFRGNEPLNTSYDFVYDELVSVMRQVAQEEADVELPEDFLLVDVNLLNFSEQKEIDIEKAFFEKNPEAGSFMNWVIVGDVTNPNAKEFNHTDTAMLRKDMAIKLGEWQLDHLVKRVPDLNTMLNSPASKPVIYYVHCIAGSDRTGEVCGSYYMQYLKWSFQEALAFDEEVAGRPIETLNHHALNWYCWHLYYTQGYPTDCDYIPQQSK